MKTILNRNTLAICYVVVFLTGCGGSSGGGSTTNSLSDSINSGNVEEINFSGPAQAESCRATLSDALDNISISELNDLGSGCDYFVSGSTAINGDMSIAAGVTFLMAPESSIRFNNESFGIENSVALLGTTDSPIVFIGSEEGAWRNVEFNAAESSLNNVVFSGGGFGIDADNAAVEITSGLLELNNVTVSSSVGNGVFLNSQGSGMQVSSFQNNAFINNDLHGLVLSRIDIAQFLTPENEFGTDDLSNGLIGVRAIDDFSNAGFTLRNIGVPYQFIKEESRFDTRINISDVFIEAGVELQFSSNIGVGLSSVTAQGTFDSPVVFQGIDGDEWGGIIIARAFRGFTTVLRHVQIQDAGSGTGSGGGALSASSATEVLIEDVTFINSPVWAIFCSSESSETAVLAGVSFSDSGAGDLHPDCNATVEPSTSVGVNQIDVSECAEQLVEFTSNTPFSFFNTDAQCDYYVVGSMQLSSTVQIDPGTTIVFARAAQLEFEDTVLANGTPEQPITFLGEIESDGSWEGISISGRGHSIQNVDIVDGGTEEGAGLVFTRDSSNSSTDIVLIGTSVTGSQGSGIVVEDGVEFADFSNNMFIGNGEHGAIFGISSAIAADSTTLFDSAMAPNGLSGAVLQRFTTGSFTSVSLNGESVAFNNVGVPWIFPELVLNNGSTVDFEAGSVIQFVPDASIEVTDSSSLGSSIINFNGTADEPIVVSGLADEGFSWSGIFVEGELNATHTEFVAGAMAAEEPFSRGARGAIEVRRDGRINLSNVVIRDSLGWGIACSGTEIENLMLNQVSYNNNALGDIELSCGS